MQIKDPINDLPLPDLFAHVQSELTAIQEQLALFTVTVKQHYARSREAYTNEDERSPDLSKSSPMLLALDGTDDTPLVLQSSVVLPHRRKNVVRPTSSPPDACQDRPTASLVLRPDAKPPDLRQPASVPSSVRRARSRRRPLRTPSRKARPPSASSLRLRLLASPVFSLPLPVPQDAHCVRQPASDAPHAVTVTQGTPTETQDEPAADPTSVERMSFSIFSSRTPHARLHLAARGYARRRTNASASICAAPFPFALQRKNASAQPPISRIHGNALRPRSSVFPLRRDPVCVSVSSNSRHHTPDARFAFQFPRDAAENDAVTQCCKPRSDTSSRQRFALPPNCRRRRSPSRHLRGCLRPPTPLPAQARHATFDATAVFNRRRWYRATSRMSLPRTPVAERLASLQNGRPSLLLPTSWLRSVTCQGDRASAAPDTKGHDAIAGRRLPTPRFRPSRSPATTRRTSPTNRRTHLAQDDDRGDTTRLIQDGVKPATQYATYGALLNPASEKLDAPRSLSVVAYARRCLRTARVLAQPLRFRERANATVPAFFRCYEDTRCCLRFPGQLNSALRNIAAHLVPLQAWYDTYFRTPMLTTPSFADRNHLVPTAMSGITRCPAPPRSVSAQRTDGRRARRCHVQHHVHVAGFAMDSEHENASAEPDYAQANLNERVAKLYGGVSVIRVCEQSDIEEKPGRADSVQMAWRYLLKSMTKDGNRNPTLWMAIQQNLLFFNIDVGTAQASPLTFAGLFERQAMTGATYLGETISRSAFPPMEPQRARAYTTPSVIHSRPTPAVDATIAYGISSVSARRYASRRARRTSTQRYSLRKSQTRLCRPTPHRERASADPDDGGSHRMYRTHARSGSAQRRFISARHDAGRRERRSNGHRCLLCKSGPPNLSLNQLAYVINQQTNLRFSFDWEKQMKTFVTNYGRRFVPVHWTMRRIFVQSNPKWNRRALLITRVPISSHLFNRRDCEIVRPANQLERLYKCTLDTPQRSPFRTCTRTCSWIQFAELMLASQLDADQLQTPVHAYSDLVTSLEVTNKLLKHFIHAFWMCLLDAGRLEEAGHLLRELLNKGHGADSLLFNHLVFIFLHHEPLAKAYDTSDALKETLESYKSLLESSTVRQITFTASTAIGKQLIAFPATTVMTDSLELGLEKDGGMIMGLLWQNTLILTTQEHAFSTSPDLHDNPRRVWNPGIGPLMVKYDVGGDTTNPIGVEAMETGIRYGGLAMKQARDVVGGEATHHTAHRRGPPSPPSPTDTARRRSAQADRPRSASRDRRPSEKEERPRSHPRDRRRSKFANRRHPAHRNCRPRLGDKSPLKGGDIDRARAAYLDWSDGLGPMEGVEEVKREVGSTKKASWSGSRVAIAFPFSFFPAWLFFPSSFFRCQF